MNILHIVYSGLGGASKVVFSLIKEDKKKKFNQSIFFTGPKIKSDYINLATKLGTNFFFFKTLKFLHFFSYFKIIKKIFYLKPNVIVIHNYIILPVLFYKFFNKKIKIIFVCHNSLITHTWRDGFAKILSPFFNKFVLLNKETFLFYKNKFKINLNKIILITNGIDAKKFKFRKIKKKYFKIGMACRVNHLKKYDLILNAINSNILKNCNIKFSLAGEGEELRNFKKKVSILKLNKKVITEGYLKEDRLKKWFNTLDLYIQASSGEAMSTSILQAMSFKIPVIASNVSGINSIVGREKYLGMLFNNNVNDLAKKISYFYNLPKKKNIKFIEKQYNYIGKNHNSKEMFNKYSKIFTKT